MAVCPGCGKAFKCEIEAGESWCWCFGIEASPLARCRVDKCYCETCLEGGKKPSIAELLRRISKDT